jgi:hypothetical protein
MIAEASTNSPAPTKVVHADISHCSESIARHNRRAPSQNRLLQLVPLPLTDHAGRRCFCVSHWAPRFLSPDVGVESLVADSPFYFQAFLFSLQAAIAYSVRCAVFVIVSFSSRLNAGNLCSWSDLRRVFGGTQSCIKRPRLNRIPIFALVAFCAAATPWCATGQVSNYEICEFKVEHTDIGAI